MIQWLMRLFGIEPKVAPERRRSIIQRLQTPEPEVGSSSGSVRVEATLERHRRREAAIADHKAKREAEKADCDKRRKKHQSDIHESTIMLRDSHRRRTTRRRKNPPEPNPFNIADLAKREAMRRREA